MLRKRAKFLVLGAVAFIVVLCVGVALLIASLDLRPLIERYASKSLGRQLSLGDFRIGWSAPLSIELHDLHLANAPWGTQSDMVAVAGLSAKIDVWPLLHGVIRYEKLQIDGLTIRLERDPAGVPNWRFGESSGGFALIPKNRTQFPTLIDLTMKGSTVIYRLSSGGDLTIGLDNLAIRSAGDGEPASMALDGTYNDTAMHLNGLTDSFSVLRDKTRPWSTDFSIATLSTTIAFKGTMTAPLDFDGLHGRLHIQSDKMGALLKIFGTEAKSSLPLELDGAFDRKQDSWVLSDASGKLAANAFAGSLALLEGTRTEPDKLTISLNFPRLDLKTLGGGASEGKSAGMSLKLDDHPATVIRASIDSVQAFYGATQLDHFSVKGKTDPGAVAIESLAFDYGDGHVVASGNARSVANGSEISAKLSLSHIDIGAVARLFGAPNDDIGGRLDGLVSMGMTGNSLDDASANSHGEGVLTATNGSVSRALIETVSSNLRALFRSKDGPTAMSCLLGVVILDRGMATLAPFRLRSADGVVIGNGVADLQRRHLDLTIKTIRSSTDFFALDVPLRLSGSFDSVHVLPTGRTKIVTDNANADRQMLKLSPEARHLAEGSSCVR